MNIIPGQSIDVSTTHEEVVLAAKNASIFQTGVVQLADNDLQNNTDMGKVISFKEIENYINFLKKPVISILTQPVISLNFTQGSISGNISVVATVSKSISLSYQWYSNTSNSNTGGTLIIGATGSSFTIPTTLTASSFYYYCVVSAVNADSVKSNVTTVTITAPVITIVTQPTAQIYVTQGMISGSYINISATVTGGATLSYQWYSNTTSSNVGGTAATGPSATTASFTIPVNLVFGTYYYYCVVGVSGVAVSKASNVAQVNVQPKLT